MMLSEVVEDDAERLLLRCPNRRCVGDWGGCGSVDDDCGAATILGVSGGANADAPMQIDDDDDDDSDANAKAATATAATVAVGDVLRLNLMLNARFFVTINPWE